MRLLLVTLIFIGLLSCKKENCNKPDAKKIENVNAHVIWGGAPEVDGLGWVIKPENARAEKPSNLPDEFKVDSLAVRISYEPSTEKYPCFCINGFIYTVKINSIERR